MAYPFAKMPRLDEFIQRARACGAELVEASGSIIGPRGEIKVRYLRRVDGKDIHFAVLPDCPDDEVLTPSVVRQLCGRLGIDTRVFGFSLTDDGWEQKKPD